MNIQILRVYMKKAKNKVNSIERNGRVIPPLLIEWRRRAIIESQKGYGNHNQVEVECLIKEYQRYHQA